MSIDLHIGKQAKLENGTLMEIKQCPDCGVIYWEYHDVAPSHKAHSPEVTNG